MKQLLIIILSLMCTISVQAKKDRYTRVYMFGVATNLNDSTVYITDIQTIDSAFVSKEGALTERSIYSYQLQTFFEEKRNLPNMTTAVIWSDKAKRVEKRFLKMRRRFAKDSTTLVKSIDRAEFNFAQVEHYENSIQ